MHALRRKKQETKILQSGTIEVYLNEMQAYKNGVPLSLSRKEMQLLVYPLLNAGQIVTKENILERIWEVDGQFIDENTVTVNISRLKNRLETEDIIYM